MRLVGLVGTKGSGKTTFAEMLVRLSGGVRLSMADPLRAMLRAFGLSAEELADPELKERPSPLLFGRTPRWALQTLGTEWGRNLVHPEIWVAAMERRLDMLHGVPLAVVDDIRFRNEAAMISRRGGRLIRLVRGESRDRHASETETAAIACPVIFNTGSVAELEEAARALWEELHDA